MNKTKSKKPPVSKTKINQLFELITTSTRSTQSICKEINICFVTVWRMMNTSKRLSKQYARAKEEQSDYLVESIQDRIQEGYTVIKTGKWDKKLMEPKALNAMVQMIRVDTDTLKWIAGKLKPNRYGDKLELSGSKDHSLWPKKVSVEIVKPVQKASRNKVKAVRK